MLDSNASSIIDVKTFVLSTPATPPPSKLRRNVLLLLFSLAQFLDAFNISAVFTAIPVISGVMGLSSNESVWLVSAFQLTFAVFLLVSGRVSDLFGAKWTFASGCFLFGVFSLVAGFGNSKYLLFVMRALAGIAASFTIPSALTMITRLFPDKTDRATALTFFGAFAALGNILGLIIGGAFTTFASWRWVFWFGAITAILVAIFVGLLAAPEPVVEKHEDALKKLDFIGIFALTTSLILLVFAFTSTGNNSWGETTVLVPFMLGIVMMVMFFVWEWWIPAEHASLPAHVWLYPNFPLIIAISLSIFGWFSTVFLFKFSLWQETYGWSAFSSALHALPIGIVVGPVLVLVGLCASKLEHKHLILLAQLMLLAGSVLLPFARDKETYWSRDLPALILGAMGAGSLFVLVNVAIFHNTPPAIAGVVGAALTAAQQLGSAVSLSVVTAIQTAVDKHDIASGADVDRYNGRAAGFWFWVGVVALQMVCVLVMYRPSKSVDHGKIVGSGFKDPEKGVSKLVENGKPTPAIKAVGMPSEKGSGKRVTFAVKVEKETTDDADVTTRKVDGADVKPESPDSEICGSLTGTVQFIDHLL